MAEKTTDKPAAKSPAKIFDVSKPGKSSANASSRPIILNNRPIMQDPMMTHTDAATQVEPAPSEAAASPSLARMNIKPLSEDKIDSPDRPTASIEPEATEAAEPASEKSTTEDPEPASDNKPNNGKPVEPSNKTPQDTGAPAPAEAAPPATAQFSLPAPEEPDPAIKSPEKSQDQSGATANDLPGTDPDQADTATAALEAAAKKQEELDAMVEAKTYFLPINAVELRRSKYTALVGFVLIVILGLALLDVMLDAGFIRINGLHAVTHIFST